MPELKLYKASAGSGKTYSLILEYLSILLANPSDYRKVLAVTFTQKATGEMKQRIIQELHALATDASGKYQNSLQERLRLTVNEIRIRASLLLSNILHDYSRFQVSTIDSFFQGIIASFARDMGLQSNYTIELDSDAVLSASVDALLLKADDNSEIRNWIYRFAEERIRAGKQWDMQEDIRALGRELFSEKYMAETYASRQVLSMAALDPLQDDIRKYIHTFEQQLKKIGDQALDAIAGANLGTDDFFQKTKGPAGFFNRLSTCEPDSPNSYVLKCLEDANKWASGSARDKALVSALVASTLLPLLQKAVHIITERIRVYQTAKMILSRFYTLGLLHELEQEIMEYLRERNIFLLAHAPLLINRLILENDAPFIYERAGNAYNNFLIDEFQDTSVLQWGNFRPLIHNSLAAGYPCMLVGDIKQSIYRWRNSSWETLAFLHEQEPDIKTEKLQVNRRSKPEIVQFNNTCFLSASAQLQAVFSAECDEIPDLPANPMWHNLIGQAYSDLLQQWPESAQSAGPGIVKVKFLNEKTDEEHSENIEELILQEIKGIIDKVVSDGYHLSDIAILVRRGREGSRIAEYLVNSVSETGGTYRVISDDSLNITSSGTVRLLVALMKYLLDNSDEVNNEYLVAELSELEMNRERLSQHGISMASLLGNPREMLSRLLPDEFSSVVNKLRQLPVFDLAQHLLIIFQLGSRTDEIVYQQAFLDAILDCNKNATSDIASFLDWWQTKAEKYSISASEEQDAIRISTIHKAKGLQYKVVLVPYCNWPIDHPNNMGPVLWCRTNEAPFRDAGLLPFKYTSGMTETLFVSEFMKEKQQAYVDSLNLMYVAFTRAIDGLYVICPEGQGKGKTVSSLLKDSLRNAPDYSLHEQYPLLLRDMDSLWDEDNQVFAVGKPCPASVVATVGSAGLTIAPPSLPGDRIRILLHGDEYFLPVTDPVSEAKMNKGTLLHEAFSRMKTLNDMPAILQSLVNEGKITAEESNELQTEILDLTNDPRVAEWFGADWRVLNEATIICRNQKALRPDRVLIRGKEACVIDFKFGDTAGDQYRQQVKSYMKSLQSMGYSPVKGMIWYVRMQKIEEVD